MALICDTGGVYALYDADDVSHLPVKKAVEAEVGALYVPSVLLAEIGCLLSTHLGPDAELDFLQGIRDGALVVIPPTADDFIRCQELIREYRDRGLGLADASVVATAERLGVFRLLTVDERHYRTVTPRGASQFTLLPADQ